MIIISISLTACQPIRGICPDSRLKVLHFLLIGSQQTSVVIQSGDDATYQLLRVEGGQIVADMKLLEGVVKTFLGAADGSVDAIATAYGVNVLFEGVYDALEVFRHGRDLSGVGVIFLIEKTR